VNNIHIRRLYEKELARNDTRDLTMLKKERRPLLPRLGSLWKRQSPAVRIAFISLISIIITGFIYYYNIFIKELYKLKASSAQIQTQLQRRNDLIPNLVNAVYDYMDHERFVFIHAADVRASLGEIDKLSKTPDMEKLGDALSRFQAVAENYPDLKASNPYQNLMNALADTENRIAMTREEYNRIANWYNTRISLFPGKMFGYILGFKAVETFKADEGAEIIPVLKNKTE
jgi:LemA protein